jgi:DNA-binding transcriptional MerR regulator
LTAASAPDRGPAGDKSPDAFRTISEVAEDLALPQHVLRFWETRFIQIKPLKRGGGRRYYRPDDVDLLRGIKFLLYVEGYTIKGVQRILKAQGLKFVQMVWRDPSTLAATSELARASRDHFNDEDDEDTSAAEAPAPPEMPLSPPVAELRRTGPPPAIAPERRTVADPVPVVGVSETSRRLVLKPPDEDAPADAIATARDAAQAREDTRRLQAALFELMEAKRLLDAALRRPSAARRGEG